MRGYTGRLNLYEGRIPKEDISESDHYQFDFLVPREVGIQAFYVDRSGQKNGDFILKDLRELEKKLG